MARISRRSFLKGAGVAATAVVVPGCERPAPQVENQRAAYLFFNAQDADFIEAAVARLIPADESGPGAIEAGVPAYIDRQLAGAWGAGERLYRSGPWQAGKPGQGYQLPFTPAELFRNALRTIAADLVKSSRTSFPSSIPSSRMRICALENEVRDLDGVPANSRRSLTGALC
jgi:gluconate 2-dehydrogenase gamma chain